jgi:hypothetical protein
MARSGSGDSQRLLMNIYVAVDDHAPGAEDYHVSLLVAFSHLQGF